MAEEEEEGEERTMEEMLAAERETEHKGVSKQIEEALLAGATKEELIAQGFNPNSVRTIMSELKTKHGREFGVASKKKAPATSNAGKGTVVTTGKPTPELLIQGLKVPDGERDVFESGLKFGMNLVVLGVRVAQELSAIGVQQAKPLLDMAKDMRAGEIAAARSASAEGAMLAAATIDANISPVLAQIIQTQKALTTSGDDPMKGMMVRIMEPLLQNVLGSVMGKMMPGMGGGTTAPGWTKKEL